MEKKESKNARVAKKKKRKLMFLSNCVVCDCKKSRFIKNQETSNLGLKTSLSEIPLLGDILF